jgi:hypothetical protein
VPRTAPGFLIPSSFNTKMSHPCKANLIPSPTDRRITTLSRDSDDRFLHEWGEAHAGDVGSNISDILETNGFTRILGRHGPNGHQKFAIHPDRRFTAA